MLYPPFSSLLILYLVMRAVLCNVSGAPGSAVAAHATRAAGRANDSVAGPTIDAVTDVGCVPGKPRSYLLND